MAPSTPTRTTSGHRLTRTVAVGLVPLYAAGMLITEVLRARSGLTTGAEDLAIITGFGGFAIVGAVLVLRRPEHLVSWLIALIPLVLAVAVPAEAWAGYMMTVEGRPDALSVVGAWLNSWYWYVLVADVFVFLPLVFPEGRLPSPRWRVAAVLPAVGTVAVAGLAAVARTLHGQDIDYVIDNPIGLAGVPPLEQNPAFGVLTIPLIVGVVAGVAAMVVRFRGADGTRRAQMKWVLAALPLFPLSMLFEGLAPGLSSAVFALALLCLPAAIAVAILRYRLYDIDRLVSRTVAYGLVTAVLLGLYALVAVVPAAIFDLQSDLLVAAATLAAAAAFGPVRRHVQTVVDRRFHRSRYDAQLVAERFAARLRDEVDLDDLTADLRTTVANTVRPGHLSLWVRTSGRQA